ncbi:MAG: DUF4114 domain-containing protein [Bryobacteraceae bacterium]|nr:DUF4114 domain-containing protein [Bryobacteraceae bacterium]
MSVFAAGVLSADIVEPAGSLQWTQLSTPVTIGAGQETISGVNAYWNNTTFDYDGECANIGCFLTKSGAFVSSPLGDNSPNLSNPVYLEQSGGGQPVDFYFNAPPFENPVTLLLEIAGLNGVNWFGWYDASKNVADLTDDDWETIFVGGDSQVTPKTFTPTTNFGFWFVANNQNPIVSPMTTAKLQSSGFFTESSQNAYDNDRQHFALFARSAVAANALPAEFWMGIEDLTDGDTDNDYNDMVIKFTVVPEPGYYALLGIGLAGLAYARRRHRVSSK